MVRPPLIPLVCPGDRGSAGHDGLGPRRYGRHPSGHDDRGSSGPTVTLSLDDALTQARGQQSDLSADAQRCGPCQVGRCATRTGISCRSSTSRPIWATSDRGNRMSAEVSFSPPPHFSPRITASASSGRSTAGHCRRPGQQKALQRATDEDISGAGVALRSEIETQYLNTLQATAQVAVARQQVTRNADFLALAKARYQVGQATLLDVRQAEVIKGQSDVALLRAVQTENEAKLDLIRRMGVEPPVPVEQIALTDSFPVTAPAFDLDTLLRLADAQNPALRSLRARRTAASWNVRAAKSEFLPTLSAAGRMERLHPAVHQQRPAPQPVAGECPGAGRRLSVQQPGPLAAEPRRRSGQLFRRRRTRRRRQRAARPGQPADPEHQQRLPVPLYRTAVPGQLPGLASDLHRVRSLAPGVASQGAGRRRGRGREGPTAPGPERRARALPRAPDLLPGDRRPVGQPGGGARSAPAGPGPLPARRGHVARGVGRAERRPESRRRLRERDLRLSQSRSPRWKPRSAAHFANEERTCRAG